MRKANYMVIFIKILMLLFYFMIELQIPYLRIKPLVKMKKKEYLLQY